VGGMIFYLMVFEFRRGGLSVACPHPALCATLASEGQKYCPPLGEVAVRPEEDEITSYKTTPPHHLKPAPLKRGIL